MKKLIFVLSSVLALSSCGKKSDSNNNNNNEQPIQIIDNKTQNEEEKNFNFLKLLASGFRGADDIGFNLSCHLQENNKKSVKCYYSFLHSNFIGSPELILFYNGRYQINVYTRDDYTCSLQNECDDKATGTCKISYKNENVCKIMNYIKGGFDYNKVSDTKGVIFFDRANFVYTFSSWL